MDESVDECESGPSTSTAREVEVFQMYQFKIHIDPRGSMHRTVHRRQIQNPQMVSMDKESEDRVRKYAEMKQDPAHVKMLKRIFDEKKKEFDKYVKEEGLKRWSSAFQSTATNKAVMKRPLVFTAINAVQSSRVNECSEDPSVKLISSPVVVLEPCTVMPRQNYFLSVTNNFKTKDTTVLSHIPYVGDDDHDEEAFTKDLVQLYNEGVHGTRKPYKRGINDRILFEMLGAIGFKSRNNPELRDKLFAVLSHLFPDKCGVNDIHKKAISLRSRFIETNRLPYPAPNYDGEAQVMLGHEMKCSVQMNREECYRCGDYHCIRHDQIDPSILKQYRKMTAPPGECLTESEPCSFLCHFLFKERMIHQEENMRLNRFKNGEWKPFWYKIIVKVSMRRGAKRTTEDEEVEPKKMRMDGSGDGDEEEEEEEEGDDKSDDEEEKSEDNEEDEDEDEDENEDEEMSERDDYENDEDDFASEIDKAMGAPTPSSLSTRSEDRMIEDGEDEAVASTSSSTSRWDAGLGRLKIENGESGSDYGEEQRGWNEQRICSRMSAESSQSLSVDYQDENSLFEDGTRRDDSADASHLREKFRNQMYGFSQDSSTSMQSSRRKRSIAESLCSSRDASSILMNDLRMNDEPASSTSDSGEVSSVSKESSITSDRVMEDTREGSSGGESSDQQNTGTFDDESNENESVDEEEDEERTISRPSSGEKSEEIEEDEEEDEEGLCEKGSENEDKVEDSVGDEEFSEEQEVMDDESSERRSDEEEVELDSDENNDEESSGSSTIKECEEEMMEDDDIENGSALMYEELGERPNTSNGMDDVSEMSEESHLKEEEKEADSDGEIREKNEDEEDGNEDGIKDYDEEVDGESDRFLSEDEEDDLSCDERESGGSSFEEEEDEPWTDEEEEWEDEILEDDGESVTTKTRRSFSIRKKDVPPKDWREKLKAQNLPAPFWTQAEEEEVIQALSDGQSVCEIASELQNELRSNGRMDRYRECYEVHAYLKSKGLVPTKQEYDEEEELSYGERLQILRTWKSFNATVTMKNDHALNPCFHTGKCDEQTNPPCHCFRLDIPCTKFCACDIHCRIKWPGCMCRPGKCRTKQCPCYFASWECDPDTCKYCGCDESDPEKQCQNMPISLGQKKRLFASRSEIAGYGGFIGEPCKKGELVEEYVGEIISVEESERRGRMYDKLKLSYTFTLNDDEVVDATRAGNVARFINHSKFPNCVARVFVVRGDHRIGIFARRDLVEGEELFFNYGYKKEHAEAFTNKERDGCDRTLLDVTAKNVTIEDMEKNDDEESETSDEEKEDEEEKEEEETVERPKRACRYQEKTKPNEYIESLREDSE